MTEKAMAKCLHEKKSLCYLVFPVCLTNQQSRKNSSRFECKSIDDHRLKAYKYQTSEPKKDFDQYENFSDFV